MAAEKSVLATLRKKTGYTFSNCKKALEMHNNDFKKAEEWLHQQAQSLGWSKATKLEGRQTTQGLIGVCVDNHDGVLVEINCETDFVARNKEFEEMVKEAAASCLNHVKNSPKSGDFVTKVALDSEQLKNLQSSNGKSLADRLALMIGAVGENATLKRAVGLKVSDKIHLSGYAHPSGKTYNKILLGRIGGLVAVKSLSDNENSNVAEVSKGLCQHIVGMAPKRTGKVLEEGEEITKEEQESSLIYQEYLLDESVSVKELLEENQLEVVEFKRFECGEDSEVSASGSSGDQPLEAVARALEASCKSLEKVKFLLCGAT